MMTYHNYKISLRKSSVFIVFLCLLILTINLPAQQNVCADFQSLVDKTYNFKPSEISPEEIDKKSAEMDVIWKKVTADKEQLLPCLKDSIKKESANNFFVFDGSNLLFKLEPNDDSKRFLLKAFSQVDLADVNLPYWIRYVALLGFEGFDTREAAINWLKTDDPGYYLPQHGTRKVTREIGALIIFGSMDEKFAVPALEKLLVEKKAESLSIAITMLVKISSDDSERVLYKLDQLTFPGFFIEKVKADIQNPKLIAPRDGQSKISRKLYLEAFTELAAGDAEKFMGLTVEVPDGEKDAVSVLGPEDIDLVRKGRRYFAATATPHSPEWYDSFTQIINTLKLKKGKSETK